MVTLNIPSPPISVLHLGPVSIHIYALCLLTGIIFAWWFSSKRIVARGGNRDDFDSIIMWAVILGILGARFYHVVTHYDSYFGAGKNPLEALKIWNGGLAIWGSVAAGCLTILVMTKRRGINTAAFVDALAPAVIFAQGIGRLGNWFNQELFGRPTLLPWGLEIDPANRPAGFEQYSTFHPTFLYELIWNVTGGLVLLWLERKFKLGRGRVFVAYVAWYSFGRSCIEAVRIDPAVLVGSFRINNVVFIATFVLAIAIFIWLSITKSGQPELALASTKQLDEDSVPAKETS